jgi:predicted GNAT family acetyltransferase
MNIQKHVTTDRIAYRAASTGALLAEIDFPVTGAGVQTITHTLTDDSLRGRGIAGELVQAAIDAIHKNGNRVAATCSYAQAWLERHPDALAAESEGGAHA